MVWFGVVAPFGLVWCGAVLMLMFGAVAQLWCGDGALLMLGWCSIGALLMIYWLSVVAISVMATFGAVMLCCANIG